MIKLTVYINLLDHLAFNLVADIVLQYALDCEEFTWSKDDIMQMIESDCNELGWKSYEIVDYCLG
jgi:hypothetical protein